MYHLAVRVPWMKTRGFIYAAIEGNGILNHKLWLHGCRTGDRHSLLSWTSLEMSKQIIGAQFSLKATVL